MRFGMYGGMLVLAVVALVGCGGGGGAASPAGDAGVSGGAVEGYVYYQQATGDAAPLAGKVSGRALRGTQVPVEGATIAVDGQAPSATTDANGFFRVHAASGRHTLAISHAQFREELDIPVTVTEGATTSVDTTQTRLPIGYYVGVGIGDYTYLNADLGAACVNDAQAVSTALFNEFQGNSVVLTDGQATKANIKAAIADAAAKMAEDDFFIFYYSGHGGSDDTGIGSPTWIDYILPADSISPDHTNDITDRELKAWLQAMPNPAHAIVILDSCFAGAFFDGKGVPASQQFAPYTRAVTLKALGTLGCTVIASSSSYETSIAYADMSLFTRVLVESLTTGKTTADVNVDRQVTAQEAYDYTAPRTAAAWLTQHPQLQVGENPVLVRY